MKILHISTQNSYTSGWNYHENLLPKYHKKLGNEVTIIVPDKKHDENSPDKIVNCEEGTFFEKSGVKVIRKKLLKKHILFFAIPYEKIEETIISERPDLIFVHGMVSLSIQQVAKYVKTHTSCIAVCDNHLDDKNCNISSFKTRLHLFFLKIFNKKALKYFSYFYGVTPGRTEFAIKYLGAEREKSKTSIMGGDDEKIRDAKKTNTEVVFVTGGKINKDKGIYKIIDTFHKTKIEAKLLVFGSVSDDLKSSFDEIIKNDSRIQYIGWKREEEIYDTFLASDVAVFYNSHSVLWEIALSCGRPIIAKIECGFEHLLIHNNSWKINNTEELKEAFVAFNNRSNEAKNIINNAEKYKKYYSYYNIAKGILNDYNYLKTGSEYSTQ